MAKKIKFPLKMNQRIYTQHEFRLKFLLNKYTQNSSIAFLRPISRNDLLSTKVSNISDYKYEAESLPKPKIFNQDYAPKRICNKLSFLKPIARNENLYIQNGYKKYIEKKSKLKYINNINTTMSSTFTSGSFSSFNLDEDCNICGYGLELI